jgi:hypothetical protein
LLDLDGEQLERIDFGGTLLDSYRVNENGCVFLLDSDTVHAKSRVLACDKRGSLLYEKELDVDLSAVTMDERYVYMLGDGVLLRASLNSDRVDELVVSAGAEGILLSDEGQLRLLYAGAAEFVEFD